MVASTVAMRLLVVEDEADLRRSLEQALREEGYAVDGAGDGADALYKAETWEYDAIVLDIMLPGLDGWEILRRLREKKKVPVLLLTARDDFRDRVRGLDLGADDYMAKPFALSELEARVRALTRRALGSGQNLLRHGDLCLDPVGRVATINDVVLDLSGRELGLLETLLQRAGRLVSKEQLVDHLCEWGDEVSNNAIEVYVHRLRKKLEPSGVRIATVRGLGYCLERPVEGASNGHFVAVHVPKAG